MSAQQPVTGPYSRARLVQSSSSHSVIWTYLQTYRCQIKQICTLTPHTDYQKHNKNRFTYINKLCLLYILLKIEWESYIHMYTMKENI
jgi:hypothetical protein